MKSTARLVRAEIGKLKGSLAAMMAILGPAAVIVFAYLIAFARGDGIIERTGWQGFFQGGVSLWAYVVFPLLVALQAAAINSIEHSVDGWKRYFALPVRVPQAYLGKLFVFIALMIVATLVLACGFLVTAWLLSISDSGMPKVTLEVSGHLFRNAFACLAGGMLMMVIHFVMSWTMRSFVAPLAVGVIGVMAIMQVASSKYWVWHPWSWGLTAAAASDPVRVDAALLLGLGGGLLFALATIPLARRLRGIR